MTHASLLITSACARMSGNANPVTTITAVTKRPKSTAPVFSYSAEKSSLRQFANSELGRGAITNVKAGHVLDRSVRVRAMHRTNEKWQPVRPQST